MQTSDAMQKMIEGWEGLRLKAYPDPASGGDPWTIGYGHTGPDVYPGVTINAAQADELLEADLRRFETAVGGMAHTPTQGQFDALVSFTYNLGEAALEHSHLLQYHNEGKFAAAADEFLKWDHAGGRQLSALTKRRQGERAVYLNQTPAAVALPSITLPSVRDLQAFLAARGFDPGPIDGICGDRTCAALKAYYAG